MFQYELMLRDAPSDFFSPANGFPHLTPAPAKSFAVEPVQTNSTALIISTRHPPALHTLRR